VCGDDVRVDGGAEGTREGRQERLQEWESGQVSRCGSEEGGLMRTRFFAAVLFALAAASTVEAAIQQAPTDSYVYQPAGRRDPFLNLLGTGVTPPVPSKRGEGVAGLMVNEIAVRGVMQSGAALIAMIQGPDGRHHIIRPGDKFMDGAVKAITLQGLVIVQDVNDPLSLEKRREVRKLLKSAEGAKP
jgi:Tfp pilus assembly protein PilP